MSYIETFFITSYVVAAVSLGMLMLLSYLLFRSLKKNHAAYYKSIGEPIIVMLAKLKSGIVGV